MIIIKVITAEEITSVRAEGGQSLLEILRKKGYNLYAPCGGKGTCGKCTLMVRGEGEVISCKYYPAKDIEVVLPGETEARILVHQTEYLEEMPFKARRPEFDGLDVFGVAIDVGTTTLVIYFLNLKTGEIEKVSSFLNPQKAFGADIISRINYCQEHEGGLSELQTVILDSINRQLDGFRKIREPGSVNFERIVIVGNTTMLHLLLGEDPVSIALAPFVPKFTDRQTRKGLSSGLKINNEGEVITLPCLSAFVGADIIAGLSVLKPKFRNYLFLDIGTNGEMAIVKGKEIVACATAAGPAFEGANISCGMAAVNGAVSAFHDPGKYQVIGGSEPAGICGSGIVDLVAYLLRTGRIDETGRLTEPCIVHSENKIMVTQEDIREIQLAKSAVFSGIKILMKITGLTFGDLDALYLAGGFGNYINIRSATDIGLLPREMEGRIYPVGNSAGIGALQYLRNQDLEQKISHILGNIQYVELSNVDEFATEFAMNMNFTVPDTIKKTSI